jgi:hypothetical protein
MPTLYISCKSHAIETLTDKWTLIRSIEIETEKFGVETQIC